MTDDELIDQIFEKEGVKYGDQTTKPPIDQPTGAGGIVLATLAEYYKAKGIARIASVADLKALTKETARPIVEWKLWDIAQRFGLAHVAFAPLRNQLIDFHYNSGVYAVKWLQRVLRVKVTGKMDADTIYEVNRLDGFLVNQALVAARLQMIDMWTDSEQRRKAWEEGLENRTLKFSLLQIGLVLLLAAAAGCASHGPPVVIWSRNSPENWTPPKKFAHCAINGEVVFENGKRNGREVVRLDCVKDEETIYVDKRTKRVAWRVRWWGSQYE